ncbi:MAG: dihydropteroate synthase [Patescibacteria group bacterium]
MKFDWGTKTFLCGVINVTPDSFSGDGLLQGGDWISKAVKQGKRQEADGADILDVGGESTRPGSTPISSEEELARVIPVIRRLAKEVKIPISIDTYKAEVARQAIEAGASMINDVWALQKDPNMAAVAARASVPIILMHNRSQSDKAQSKKDLGGRYVGMKYDDLMADIKRELQISINQALDAGVKKENIIIDPGIGFGKTVEQNLELVRRFGELKDMGYPTLAGPSRKSFVGYTLNLPLEERIEGTAAAVTLLIEKGADIIRVHDVAAMRRVATLADVIVRQKF